MRFLLLATALLLPLPTFVAAGPYDDLARIDVLPGWRTASGDHIAGIQITLQPGWKTYWRAPGDAGIPPQFTFTGSDDIANVTPHWPTPEVFNQNGVRSIGYLDTVVFPITVSSRDASTPLQISGQLNIGVCEEICIPVSLEFEALLPATDDRDGAIAAAMIDQPLSAAEANVSNVTCAIAPIADGLRVTTTLDMDSAGRQEVVVVEAGDPSVWVSEAQVIRDGDQLTASVDMVNQEGAAFALDRSAVRITVLGSDQAVDIQGCSVD
jgi:DsbC/DsbD-like thiol-disulfide interchange protein